ncbi:MAG: hypothetical protein J2P16_17590, partial [Mycobacterium sp.]|nr:hypothetical protein [Mycobacterium sp.]
YTFTDRGPKLTEAGERAGEQAFGGSLTDSQRADIEQALRARWQIKDTHYLVENGQILVYDELTGSVQPGRRFNGELHAFVEAKEGLTIHATQRAVDAKSMRDFLTYFDRVDGMTGTAALDGMPRLLRQLYGLRVVKIPAPKSNLRWDGTKNYASIDAKLNAAAADIAQAHQSGQPVLVVSEPLRESEQLAGKLGDEHGVHGNAHNARVGPRQRQGFTISIGGRRFQVTMSTNMGGRGTDIRLGGDRGHFADNGNLDETNPNRVPNDFDIEKQRVLALGGLRVVITDEAPLDATHVQKVARAARQSDPGSAVKYRSLEDRLLYEHADPIEHHRLLEKYRGRTDQISDKAIDKLFKQAKRNARRQLFRQVRHIAEHPEDAETVTVATTERASADTAETGAETGTDAEAGERAKRLDDASTEVDQRGDELSDAQQRLGDTEQTATDPAGIFQAAAEVRAAEQRLNQALAGYRAVVGEVVPGYGASGSTWTVPSEQLGVTSQAAARADQLAHSGDYQ